MENNIFEVLGLTPEVIERISEGAARKMLKMRYRALAGLVHPDADPLHQRTNPHAAATFFDTARNAYADAEIPPLFDEMRQAWLAKLRKKRQQKGTNGKINTLEIPFPSTIKLGSRKFFEMCERVRLEDSRNQAEEFRNAQAAMLSHLQGVLWVREPWQGRCHPTPRALHPPYSLLLEDELRRVVGLGNNEPRQYVELRVLGNANTELRQVKHVDLKPPSRSKSVPPEWRFPQRPEYFQFVEPVLRGSLRPVGGISLEPPVHDLRVLRYWHHRLLKRPLQDVEERRWVLNGFPWENFAALAPYTLPVLNFHSPVVAIDSAGPEPLFRIFSAFLLARQL